MLKVTITERQRGFVQAHVVALVSLSSFGACIFEDEKVGQFAQQGAEGHNAKGRPQGPNDTAKHANDFVAEEGWEAEDNEDAYGNGPASRHVFEVFGEGFKPFDDLVVVSAKVDESDGQGCFFWIIAISWGLLKMD